MNRKNNNLQQVVAKAILDGKERLDRYRRKFLAIKASTHGKSNYFIVIREENQVQLVGYVEHNSSKSYTQGNAFFQEALRRASLDIETIIVTIGEVTVRQTEYTGRVYLPTHIDAYEHHRVVRDVTGYIG